MRAPSHLLLIALVVLAPPMMGTRASAQTCTSCCESLCGDGVLDPGEECDDGGQVGNGCCGPRCKLTARCTLGAALASAACAGQTIPPGVTAKLTIAENLIDQAGKSAARKARKLLRKAKGALKRARVKAAHAASAKRPTLSAGCAAAVGDAAQRVAADL